MFGLKTWELLAILFLVVLFFGAKRLPMLGHSLGGMLGNFRRALGGNASGDRGSQQGEKDRSAPTRD